MTGIEYLVTELQKYRCICYYPSSGTDLSDLDFFASGRQPAEERRSNSNQVCEAMELSDNDDPDLFIHTDINFYMEFAAGKDLEANECGINGPFEIIAFRELPPLKNPNRIFDNYDFSGKCFEYQIKLRKCSKIRTLIFCLCENEFFVSQILLHKHIKVPLIWCKNWNGSSTYGTWLANILDSLHTQKLYTDWLCIPGQRGQPQNRHVEEKYPQLMVPAKVRLIRSSDIHWIEEGAHGWVEEFCVITDSERQNSAR
jgi:hypothetical protein